MPIGRSGTRRLRARSSRYACATAGINGGFERLEPLVNNLSIARPRRNPQPLALAHSACRPAIRTESFGLSLPPGTFDSWKMPPHRGAISSDHVRVEGLR